MGNKIYVLTRYNKEWDYSIVYAVYDNLGAAQKQLNKCNANHPTKIMSLITMTLNEPSNCSFPGGWPTE